MATEQELNKTNPLHKEFQSLLEKDFKDRKLVENKVIEATVVEILKAHVVVDCRGKSEAMIPLSEFKESELSKLKVGDKLSCFLERIESNRTGEIVLSYSKAKSMAAWEKCIVSFEKEEELECKIQNRIKGGFVGSLFSGAIHAFLPNSHLDIRPIRGAAVDKLMNIPIKVQIVRLDRARGNISISRRQVLEKSKNAEVLEALKNIKEGSIVEDAIVKATTDWGIFLDINGVDALLHVSDLSHGRVKKPSDLVTIGQRLRVKIVKICKKTNRVSASIKAMTECPYSNIEKRLKLGEFYEGTITKIVEYGCFVRIEDGIEGLIHNSELDWTNRNVNPNKILAVSQKIRFQVVNIDKDAKRISLSYKAGIPNPWEGIKDKIGKEVKIKVDNITEKALFGSLIDSKLSGMCHSKELAWNQNTDELKKYKRGDVISVKIIEVKDNKIRFSKRALEKDPMDWFKENNKKIGSIISTKVVEVLKTGVKVAVDPEKKIITTIKKNLLAIEPADCRPEIYSPNNIMADAKIIELDIKNRKIALSPKAAQQDEQKTLIEKFGEKATTSGATLKNVFERAISMASKKKKKEEK